MKRSMTIVTTCLFFAMTLAGQAAAAKSDMLLDWIIYGKHAPFFAAQDKGFYKKVGLDVEIKRGFGSGDTIKKVSAKVAPLGFAGADTLVAARANNADVKVKEVAIIHAKAMSVVVFLKEKGYKTPKDLEGARYGAPKASAPTTIFPAFASANGFDDKKVKFIEMPYGSLIPSILANRIDIITLFATELPTIRPKAAKLGKEVGTFYYGDWGVDTYSNGIVVHEDRIKSDPKFVRNAVKANMEAWAWSMLHPDEAVKLFLKYAPGMSEPIIRGHFAIAIEHLFDNGVRRHGLGYIDRDKMNKTIDLLTKLQKLPKRVPTEDIYTNRFLPQWEAIKAALGDKAM